MTFNNITSPPKPPESPRTILFLASNPRQTGRLRLDEELREIDESLRRSHKRDTLDLQNRGALRSRDFYRAILETQPNIVHFSGHGKGVDGNVTMTSRKLVPLNTSDEKEAEGLLLEDEIGNIKLVSSEQLAATFGLFADQIRCVLLNSCYSQTQATAIVQHIPYVIGMEESITDRAAIIFSTAFYDAIGAGREVEFAFKLAKIQLIDLGEEHIPQLLKRNMHSR